MKFTKNVNNKIPNLWDKNEIKILKEIQRITGLKINTKKITCKIDDKKSNGLYGYNNITLGIKGEISDDNALMVIAHELFHIFYWRKIRQMKLSKGILGKETELEWQLAEITAYLVTNDRELKKFWSNANVYLYSENKNLYDKIKKFWKKKDFEYFLKESYKIINEIDGYYLGDGKRIKLNTSLEIRKLRDSLNKKANENKKNIHSI